MSITTSTPASASMDADLVLTGLWSGSVRRVGGVPFVAREPERAAADLVEAAVRPGRLRGEHLHLANAYSVALADTRRDVQEVFHGDAAWLLPDGRPLTWISALRGDAPHLRQVRGPRFLLDVADKGRAEGLRHYLLGGSPETLAKLQASLEAVYPGILIVGSDSPPFRTPNAEELQARDTAILASGAQVVWVGLGTPKQDLEAARLAAGLPVIAVAIGAAFDYAAGSMTPAPHWMSVAGVEWLWRFAAEPRRLWRRYTVGNAQFARAVFCAERRRRLAAPAVPATTVVGQLPPPLHGSAVMTERLIAALEADGRRVTVVDRRFSRSIESVGRFSAGKLLAVPSLLLRHLRGMRGSDRLVLLITTSPGSFLVDRVLLALTRKPVVLYVHTVGFRGLAARGRVWDALVRQSLGRAERVVVLGPTLVEDVAPFVRQDLISVVPNSTPDVIRRPHRTGANLLFLSNLLPGKGADVFVRVARRLLEELPDVPWRFDIAGGGDPAVLGPIPDGVVVHGRVTGEPKEDLLESADLLIAPTTYAKEAQPLVIIEAMSHGLPVVAYDNGGVRDLVDGSVGALVPASDEDTLMAEILALVGRPFRMAHVRQNARDRYVDRHAPAAFAAAWSDLLGDPREPELLPAGAATRRLRVGGAAGRRHRVGAP